MKLGDASFAALRALVEDACGVAVPEAKRYLLETRLVPVLKARGLRSFEALCLELRRDDSGRLREQVVEAVVTHETLWFRDAFVWEMLEQLFLPAWLAELEAGSRAKVRIWCAACATGQEPYSVAMTVLEQLAAAGLPASRAGAFEILGSDVSAEALRAARSQCYEKTAIARGLAPARLARFFEETPAGWRLRPEVARPVRLERRNLMDDFAGLPRFDLVLCRNVLIYFAEARRPELAARIAERLAPGGALVLGGSERLPRDQAGLEREAFGSHVLYRAATARG